MSSLIFNPSNNGNGSVSVNVIGDDKNYNLTLPNTNGTLVSTVNGKTANNNGSVTIDVGVKSVNGVAPDSKGNVAVKVQSVASSDEVVAGTDNTKMMTPLRTKESVQQFSPTDYVTGLSVSGQTVTFTKKNGTTGKITTQDTKYTHPNSGVSAGTYNTVTVNAQGHVTGGNNVGYLRLTGGILTGLLRMTKDTYIGASQDENIKGLEIGGGRTWKDGAGLFLRNNSATGEGESGQWGLVAQNAASGTEGVLIGHADNLWFNGGIVERSNEIFGSVIEGGFYDVYRYTTGLQIIIAGVTIPGNQLDVIFTFPRPFINQSYSIAANAYTEYGDIAVTWGLDTTTSIKLYRKYYNGNFNLPTYIKCAFIGKWK